MASGLLSVFCYTIAQPLDTWIQIGLAFFPACFSFWIFLILGSLLTQEHSHPSPSSRLATSLISTAILAHASSLSIPMLFIYISLWMGIGFFGFIQRIPYLGYGLAILLSFAPFLLVTALLGLLCVQLFLLFFIPSFLIVESSSPYQSLLQLAIRLRQFPMRGVLFFFIGLAPVLFSTAFLSIAVIVTKANYLTHLEGIDLGIGLLSLMIPLTVLLAPSVSFFFQWSRTSKKFFKNK